MLYESPPLPPSCSAVKADHRYLQIATIHEFIAMGQTATKSGVRLDSGYDCEFVEPPPKQFQSECPICLLILREPRLVDCCGYSFCESCIGRIEAGKPCPLCKKTFTHVANLGLKRALADFRVYCPHRALGCEWTDVLEKVVEHVNYDPKPQHRLEGCQFAAIACVHCKEGIRRDEITDHQVKSCAQRPYTCKYCSEYKATYKEVTDDHWPKCEFFPVPCPNKCILSRSGIERQHLDKHVLEKCPLTVVQCQLHHAGCKVALPRKDMADHMKDDTIAHITLLAADNYRMSRRLVEKEEKINLLTKQNAHLELESGLVMQQMKHVIEGTQEFTRLAPTLKKTVRDLSLQLTQTEQELAKMNGEITSLSQELTQTKEEFARSKARIASQSQELTLAKQDIIRSEHKVTSLSQQLTTMAVKLDESQRIAADRLEASRQDSRAAAEGHRNTASLTIKMPRFQDFKEDGTRWHSPPFSTSNAGYKMCLRIDAIGCGDGEGTHVSVFTCLMHSGYDSRSIGPFQGSVTIRLVNQLEDKEHRTHTNRYTATTRQLYTEITHGKRSHGLGVSKFIPHAELGFNRRKNCQYLKNNCLIFRVCQSVG